MLFLKQYIKQLLMIAIGCCFFGVGINVFLIPFKLLSGGLSGIAIILNILLGAPLGITNILLNIPLFISAYFFLKKEDIIIGLFGMLFFSSAIQYFSFLAHHCVLNNYDIMLASIYGGVVCGIGGGIIFRSGGQAGGIDIIGLIIRKYYGLSIGTTSFSINVVIMFLSSFSFGMKSAMYTLIAMYISSNVTDLIINGFARKKILIIISDYAEDISKIIIKEIERGVTFIRGEGGFSGKEKKIMLIAISKLQISKAHQLIHDIDPHAFIIIQDATEVQGQGFTFGK